MPDYSTPRDPLIQRAIMVMETHLGDEDFGVAELAEEMNMSRSTLLRHVKRATGLSVAIFIRQLRLRRAKELLHDPSLTVSEVAYQTGFSSSSYFAKCFRDEFGYTPGEEQKHSIEQQAIAEDAPPSAPDRGLSTVSVGIKLWPKLVLAGGVILVLCIGLFGWWPTTNSELSSSPKTIAVLPFQNDSPDSSNVYLINGLMVAIIDNLHQVEDLQVTSRTTVERYRGVSRTVPELAEELGVSYFVEGSGQKIENEIILTLRLVDAGADTLIWARRYKRETTDIFQLQSEISTSIALEIEAIITPEEQKRLELPPTDNLLAYDYYLKGLGQIQEETREGLEAGIASLQQAIAEDPQFAHPHAYLAISYYFLDLFQEDKNHVEDINTYADRALLLDPGLNESLIGKALYYMQTGQYELAIQFFEKVLAKSPNSGWIHNLLLTIYTLHLPNTEQYLRHAVQGIRYSVAGQDSGITSMSYLHLGNALAQNGFLTEAELYVNKSLDYQPSNPFAGILSVYIELGQSHDMDAAYDRLKALVTQDTTFFATLQEVAKVAYHRGDYEVAQEYYLRFFRREEASGLNVYPDADINYAYVMEQLGHPDEAKPYREQYHAFIAEDKSPYQDLGYAVYHASMGEREKAMSHLKAFSQLEGYQFWMVRFLEEDPILKTLSGDPAYAKTVKRIQDTFWEQHQQMRKVLETEGVI